MRKALSKGPNALAGSAIASVTDLMKSGHFQVACRRHFELTHPGANSGAVGEHPNAWFEASNSYWQDKKKQTEAAGENSNATPPQPTGVPATDQPVSQQQPNNTAMEVVAQTG
jgi:hypothetical protein